MKRNKLFFNVFLSVLHLSISGYSQKADSLKPTILDNPTSYFAPSREQNKLLGPNVASFEKRARIPVNYNTGQLNYSIPLLTLPVDEQLSIPILMAYSNSGLKPSDIPSSVGNGWDINFSGTIVQYFKGLDDFGTSGLQQALVRANLDAYNIGTLSGEEKYTYFWQIASQLTDSQFDTFSLNLLGRTAHFYFDNETVKFFKEENLKVEFVGSVFTITDELGNKYIFDIQKLTTGSYEDDMFGGLTFYEGAQTWFLTKIITPNGREVTFTYQEDIGYEVRETNKSYSSGNVVSGNNCVVESAYVPKLSEGIRFIGQYLPKRIDYPAGRVEIDYHERDDLVSPLGLKGKALQTLRHRNLTNEVIGKVTFTHNYMDPITTDRLVLTSISLSGKDTTLYDTYDFDYYPSTTAVPIPGLVKAGNTINPANHAIDYQGYYNGQTTNTDKVPQLVYSNNPFNNWQMVGGANRQPNTDFSKWGMLRKITYPDKGYEWFEYEANSYYAQSNTISIFEAADTVPYYENFFRSPSVSCKTEVQTFTVGTTINNAKIYVSIESKLSPVSVRIQKLSDMSYVLNQTQSPTEDWQQVFTVNLPAGNYQYEIEAACTLSSQYSSAHFWIEQPNTSSVQVKTGGNRISKIKRYPIADTPDIRYIRYVLGKRTNYLEYSYLRYIAAPPYSGNYCSFCGVNFIATENNINSYDGFHVEYSRIIEESHLRGLTDIWYKSWPNLGAFPYFLNSSSRLALPWRSGLLEQQYQYRNLTTMVQHQSNSYSEISILPPQLKSLIVKFNYQCATAESYSAYAPWDIFSEGIVPVYTDKMGKVEEFSYLYSDEGSPLLANTTLYDYNARWQLYRVQKLRNDGNWNTQTTYYADDFDNITGTTIAALKSKHIIGKPLKVINTINGNTSVGMLTQLDVNGNPTSIYHYENNTNHTHNSSIYIGSDFVLEETRTYNSKGKLSSFVSRDGVSYVYLWSYNFTHPVALIANATISEVNALIGNIETLGAYSSESSISSALTTLRNGLPAAQVTSALYFVGIGIKQLSTPNGLNVSYEYDGKNRLKMVKDQEGRVLDAYFYQNALTLITN